MVSARLSREGSRPGGYAIVSGIDIELARLPGGSGVVSAGTLAARAFGGDRLLAGV